MYTQLMYIKKNLIKMIHYPFQFLCHKWLFIEQKETASEFYKGKRQGHHFL